MGVDTVADGNLSAVNLTNITSTDQRWSFEFTVTLATILSLVDFCIIVGNGMVLLVIVRHRGMRTRTNLFLVNLAVADLLVGLCVVPFTITTLVENRWIFGRGAVCLFNGFMNSFCLISSIHTLMYISVHKYFSIVRPLSNPLKLSYIIGMMVAAWLWAGFCSTMNITGLIVEHKPGTSQCGPRYPNDLKMYLIHGVIQVTCILIPFFILVFCYIRIFQEIKGHSQRLRTNSTVDEDMILSQQKKVAVTLLIVLATFVIMALPYFAYANYTTVVRDKTHFSIYLNPLAYTFLFMSSMCNPIIYAFRSPAFREGYKEILCQTPNYVISDDSEQIPRSNRLSSIISSIRRSSTVSRRNTVTSLYDVKSEPNSPPVPGHFRPSKKRQKSLFKLLRSTRQSNAQSVIHRNGDVIIMKSGKIVSVRRGVMEKEASPFLDRLMKFKAEAGREKGLAAGLAGPGEVMFGIICDTSGGPCGDNNGRQQKDSDTGSEWSDEVFCTPVARDVTEDNHKDVSAKTSNGTKHPHTKQNGVVRIKEPPVLDSSVSADAPSLTNKKTVAPSHTNIKACHNNTARSRHNSLENSHSDPPSDCPGGDVMSAPAVHSPKDTTPACKVPVVFINISLDDENLTTSPLAQNSRRDFAKSDYSLHRPHEPCVLDTTRLRQDTTKVRQDMGFFKPVSSARSTENLNRNRPHITRLPSVEYLDPPIAIFRSHSHGQMKTIQETDSCETRSKSPERRTRSRPPFLQSLSPFMRRKLTPNQNTPM